MLARRPAAALLVAALPGFAAAQADYEVLLLGTPLYEPVPDEPYIPTSIAAGFGESWVASVRMAPDSIGPGSMLFGDRTIDGSAGAGVLRLPGTIGGFVQEQIGQASFAGGDIAYLEGASLQNARSAWIEDRLVTQAGDAVPGLSGSWAALQEVDVVLDGSVFLRGRFVGSVPGGAGVTVVRYPQATRILTRGDAFPGMLSPVERIWDFSVSIDGMHWAAVVSTDSASGSLFYVLLDGEVFLAQGDPLPGGGSWVTFEEVQLADDGTPVVFGKLNRGRLLLEGAVRRDRIVDVRPFVGPELGAVGPRGHALLFEQFGALTAETFSLGPSTSVDVDGNGAVDPGWTVERSSYNERLAAISLDGRNAYWIAIADGPVPGAFSSDRSVAIVRPRRWNPSAVTCPGVVNATGVEARLTAVGVRETAENDVTLSCIDLPVGSAGIFLVSPTAGFTPQPGGALGNLCLDGSIGRLAPGFLADETGRASAAIDVNDVPQPTGALSIVSGQTWYFQAWYRDVAGGAPVSNLSDAIAIAFE